ncbi:MAG: porin family protein [Balneolales bacterium]
MRRLLISSVLFLAFLSYSDAEAQKRTTGGHEYKANIPNGMGIGLRGGYFLSDDAENGAWQAGIHTRFRLHPVFGIEASADYIGRQRFEIDIDDGEVTTEENDVGIIPVTVSGLVHAPVSPYFVPYGIAGVGAYFQFADFDDLVDGGDDQSTDFGFHLGGGLEIPLSNNMALHGDYRRVFLDDGLELGDLQTRGNMFTGGLTWYFH